MTESQRLGSRGERKKEAEISFHSRAQKDNVRRRRESVASPLTRLDIIPEEEGETHAFDPRHPFFFFQSFSRDGSARLAVLLAPLSLSLFSCLSFSTVANPFQVLAV